MDFTVVKKNLEKRGYTVRVFETSGEAAAYLGQEIRHTTVGIGGSVTARQMDLFRILSEENEVWWHNEPDQVEAYGAAEILSHADEAEVYLTSVNGMSESGQIINIDNTGNRIGAMCYGHRKGYVIVGKNKIAKTFEEAMWRARNIAGPKNAQRLNKKTPCAVKGDRCYDCASPDRICRGFLVLEYPLKGYETEVILVNEELGY